MKSIYQEETIHCLHCLSLFTLESTFIATIAALSNRNEPRKNENYEHEIIVSKI